MLLRKLWWVLAVVFAGNVGAQGVVAEINAHKHLGAASCASSVCHGATEPLPGSNVMQNEFSIWQENDPHTNAYAILSQPESIRIAKNLGIGDPAKADMCVDCHGGNVPVGQRGDKFQVDDGVGCESCHGGSELWISSHTSKDTKHADNIANGMYPTAEPVARAKLCLSCHMGTSDRMITHRIMGAGHPRLSFELDTFTWLNPHYQIDDDYVDRKGAFNGARDWGVGQGVSALNLLDQLTDSKAAWTGIFPELVLFDCHSCHKRMDGKTWVARPGTGLGPGIVRLNDANLLIYRYVLGLVDPAASRRLQDQTRALHQATTQSREATFGAARNLKTTLQSSLAAVAAHDFGADSLNQILRNMLADAERGEFNDYAAAEQAAMAAQSVIVAFTTAKQVDEARAKVLNDQVDRVNATVADGDAYRAGNFVAAFRQLSNVTR